MSKILGKNVSISIAVVASPEELEVVGCATEAILITNTNIAGSSTTGSGTWQEFKGLSNSWNGSINGYSTVDQNATIETVRELQFALDPIVMSFKKVTDLGDIYYTGFIIVLNVQETGNFGNAVTYSIQFQGTGELMIT